MRTRRPRFSRSAEQHSRRRGDAHRDARRRAAERAHRARRHHGEAFAGKSHDGKRSALGGAKAAADIVNLLDPSAEAPLMEQIIQTRRSAGARIQDLMFVFDNLIEVDDRGMQELLRHVPSDKLLLALKGADEALKAKIFKNMSQRAAEMLKDDLEAKGPVRLSEVEAAQKEILRPRASSPKPAPSRSAARARSMSEPQGRRALDAARSRGPQSSAGARMRTAAHSTPFERAQPGARLSSGSRSGARRTAIANRCAAGSSGAAGFHTQAARAPARRARCGGRSSNSRCSR